MQKDEQTSKEEKERETEPYTVSEIKVVHDGTCRHFYLFSGIDPEGKGEATCRDCCMGRYFDVGKYEVINGKINKKEER